MTYLYETIPTNKGSEATRFEIKQGINDAPLTHHPETGEPIRRIILGGWGLVKDSKADSSAATNGDCGCGPDGCC